MAEQWSARGPEDGDGFALPQLLLLLRKVAKRSWSHSPPGGVPLHERRQAWEGMGT